MTEILFLTYADVLDIHDNQINHYGGSSGVRDPGLLESAIMQAETLFSGEYLHLSLFDKAAAYAFHIINNHAFIDGNKRTGIVTAIVFLEINGYELTCSNELLYQFTIDISTNQKSKKQIADFFEKNSNPI